MDRLLTQIRSRSIWFLSPTRSLSSFKSNIFDFKSRAILNLINQLDRSKAKSSTIDLIYESNPICPLPGRVGFCYEIKSLPKLNSNQELLKIHTKFSSTIEIRTYDCSSSVRSELKDLFLNYNILTQPLTAITIIFKTNSDMSTWSIEVENERHQLIKQFIKLSQEICNYLNTKNYWVDFIDPSNGKPYYGPSTSDTLFETDERFQHFGINIVDLGCCRAIEHLQYGTHVFVGSIFTSAPKIDFIIPNCSK